MAQQNINTGTSVGDSSAESNYAGFVKTQANFTDIYGRINSNLSIYIKTAPVDWSTVTPTFTEASAIRVAIDALTDTGTNVIPDISIVQYRTIRVVPTIRTDTYDIYINLWEEQNKYPYVGGNPAQIGTGGNTTLGGGTSRLELVNKDSYRVSGGVVTGGRTVDFGMTGATSISDSVNASADTYTPYDVPTLFKKNDGTDDELYIYIGSTKEIGGAGTTIATDFKLLDPSINEGTPISQSNNVNGGTA